MENKTLIQIGIGLTVGIVIYRLLFLLGLLKSNETKNKESLVNIDFLNNPTKFIESAPPGAKLYTQAEASKMCKQIWDAKGFFLDNEIAALSVILAIPDKTRMAQLAERFYKDYARNLMAFLVSFLEEKEGQFTIVKNHIETLPPYKI